MIDPYMKRVLEGYDGERNSAGQRHGRGVYRYANGEVYEGDWKDDKRHGQGVLRYAGGSIDHDGQWEAGQRVKSDSSSACCTVM